MDGAQASTVESEEIVNGVDEGIEDSQESNETPDLTSMSLDELKAFEKEHLAKTKDESEELQAEGEKGNVEIEESKNAEIPKSEAPEVKTGELNPQLKQLVETVRVRREGMQNYQTQYIQTLNHLEAKAKEIEADDPREAAKIDRDIEEVQRALGEIDSDIEKLNRYENNIKIVPKYIPEGHLYTDEMIEALVEDGFDQKVATDYVTNMFANESPTAIVNLAKVGMYRRAFKNMLAEKQANKVQTKPKVIRKASTPDAVAEVINRARSIPKPLTAAPSSSSRDATLSREDLVNLSLPELNKLLKERSGNV